jgi:hypothetical protein
MAANCWPVLMSALLGAGPAAVMPAPQPNVVETTVAPAEARYCFDG